MPERYSMIGIKLFLHVKYGQPEFALPRAQNKAIIPLCIHAYLCQIVLIFLFGNKGFFGLQTIDVPPIPLAPIKQNTAEGAFASMPFPQRVRILRELSPLTIALNVRQPICGKCCKHFPHQPHISVPDPIHCGIFVCIRNRIARKNNHISVLKIIIPALL